MAEMISNDSKNKKNKKRNLRVDLTPMVDLGFLLITFFVLTTAMSGPMAMKVVVPNDRDTTTEPVCESCALTLIPGKNNVLFYYEGMDQHDGYKTTDYSAEGLRNLIMKKKHKVMDMMHNDRLVLIIKPSDVSNFKNLVDIIDEATICSVKRYYIAGLNDSERKIVQ